MDEVTRGKGKPNPAFSHLVENEKDTRKPSPREQQWEEKMLKPSLARSPERAAEFTTISDHPIRRLYTPANRMVGNRGEFCGALGGPCQAGLEHLLLPLLLAR